MLSRSSFVQPVKWAIAIGSAIVFFVALATAQIHGVAASVTSTGFGGHYDRAPGIPASVTSTGSFALQPGHQFLPGQRCCVNPGYPETVRRGELHGRGRYARGEVYAVPYYVPYYLYGDDDAEPPQEPVAEPQDEYLGGPTIFDRRGPGTAYFPSPDQSVPESSQPQVSTSAAIPPDKPEPMPQTVLVFRDGHTVEVSNYAIVGDTLFDLTPGQYQRISLAQLDLPATQRQNDDRGVDFSLPHTPQGN
jgi:hypothetical protein